MKLYYSPGACSLAARIALRELHIAAEFERVDLKTKLTETGRDFRKVNPLGYVPALELDDGAVVTENVAILPYIADLSPGVLAPLMGTFDRVRLYQTLGFLAGELHKSFSPFFGILEGSDREMAMAKLETRVDHVQRLLDDDRTYLVGGQISVADIYAFVILNWSPSVGLALERWPAAANFVGRIGSREAVKRALQEEGLA